MIPLPFQLCILAVGLVLITGCATSERSVPQRQKLIGLLNHEMQNSTGWAQVHAAEALIDHGATNKVISRFAPMAGSPPTQYRVGVWRVMARAAQTTEDRRAAVEGIQKVLRDPRATDRLQAVESLAKIGVSNPEDCSVVQVWLTTAEEPMVPFLRWLLAICEIGGGRTANEAALATLLDSGDPVTRLRAAVVLGRLGPLSQSVIKRLRDQINREREGSIARVYVITANLRQAGSDIKLKQELNGRLRPYLKSVRSNEQLEAAIILGQYGDPSDRAALVELLQSPEPDARIGAASGLLYLLQ